jgi:hypothetical protein
VYEIVVELLALNRRLEDREGISELLAVTLEAAVFIDAMAQGAANGSLPELYQNYFWSRRPPKTAKISQLNPKKWPRVADDFAIAFVPLRPEFARTRQQFLQACSKDSNSKNIKQLRTTKHNPRTHPEAQSGRGRD